MNEKNNKDWLYFSHNRQSYGTKEEKLIYDYLLNNFSKLIVPNITIPDLKNMEIYLHIVECCDLLVVAEFKGYLGKGSYREVQRAFEKNIPVKIIKPSSNSIRIFNLRSQQLEIFDQDDWSTKYARIL